MTPSGVLPPFGAGFPGAGSMSPYPVHMSEVAGRFCTSPERVQLFKGLIKLRKALADLGIKDGVQWLDGSFCEDVEVTRGRPPNDIDIVTLLVRPPLLADDAKWAVVHGANQHIFDSKQAKANFGCEAFYVDAGYPAWLVTPQITYWFGLFTHQRVSFLWKGILQVPLASDDAEALDIIGKMVFKS